MTAKPIQAGNYRLCSNTAAEEAAGTKNSVNKTEDGADNIISGSIKKTCMTVDWT